MENIHWYFTRFFANVFFINFYNTAKLNIKLFWIFMRKVKINHVFSIDTKLLVYTHIKNFPCCNIARYEISVCRVFFLKEIPWFAVFISPDSAAFTPG